jgi:hypothetical protein
VSELDDQAGSRKFDNAAKLPERTPPPKLQVGALGTEDLFHPTIDAESDWTQFSGSGPLNEGGACYLQPGVTSGKNESIGAEVHHVSVCVEDLHVVAHIQYISLSPEISACTSSYISPNTFYIQLRDHK